MSESAYLREAVEMRTKFEETKAELGELTVESATLIQSLRKDATAWRIKALASGERRRVRVGIAQKEDL